MKRNEPIKHRIFALIDEELVNLYCLSEGERERIGQRVFARLADSLMWSQGYVRDKEDVDKPVI